MPSTIFWMPFLGFLSVMVVSFPATGRSDGLIIEHGMRDSKKIALTFDACPTGMADEYDDGVVDILLRENVPATLFISGRWAEKNQERLRFLATQAQFEIANHGFHHLHMTRIPEGRARRDLLHTQDLLERLTGRSPRLFRPPFGEVDERLARLACEIGLITIQYDVASGDPDTALSAESIARHVIKNARGGSIVVFHMNRKGRHTAEVLPRIISGLRDRGYELVTVGSLIGDGMMDMEHEGPGRGESPDFSSLRFSVSRAPEFGATGPDVAFVQNRMRRLSWLYATSGPLYSAGGRQCGSSPRL